MPIHKNLPCISPIRGQAVPMHTQMAKDINCGKGTHNTVINRAPCVSTSWGHLIRCLLVAGFAFRGCLRIFSGFSFPVS